MWVFFFYIIIAASIPVNVLLQPRDYLNSWLLYAGLVLWEHTKKGFNPAKDFLKPTLGLAIEIISRGIKKS